MMSEPAHTGIEPAACERERQRPGGAVFDLRTGTAVRHARHVEDGALDVLGAQVVDLPVEVVEVYGVPATRRPPPRQRQARERR